MTFTQAEVEEVFDRQSEAMRTKDIDRLMSLYSPDIVYFDVVPPLQFNGSLCGRDSCSGSMAGRAPSTSTSGT
jgi:ketosteroid isomerase-like protein